MNTIYNTMPESEAKKKWCRHAHGMWGPARALEGNRDYGKKGGGPLFNCLGSACMAWHTTDKETTGGKTEVIGYCAAEPGRITG